MNSQNQERDLFWKQGYIKKKKYVSHQITQTIREHLKDNNFLRDGNEGIEREVIPGPNTIYPCLENLYIKELTSTEKFLKTSCNLYNGTIECFHAKFVIKPPGAMGFRPHQDYEYWRDNGYAGKSIHTIIICIDKGTITNGTTQVIPASHKLDIIRQCDFGYEHEKRFVPIELDPGDILIFHGNTIHKSNQNLSNTWRNFLVLSAVVADKEIM